MKRRGFSLCKLKSLAKRGVIPWFVIAACCLLLWPAISGRAGAQEETLAAGVEVVSNRALVDFPNQVTFQLEWATDSPIVDAMLTYDVVQDSCLEAAAQVPVDVQGNRVEWSWVMIRSGNPPPGTKLWWEWELIDAQGNSFTTPRQETLLTDDRFKWRTVSNDNIYLHWYRGDEVGKILLDAAATGLDRLQSEMGIELQSEVQLFIYGSSEDMRQAVLYIQDWAGGVAFSEYNVILIGVPPSIAEDWGRGTVRHELAHLVIGQFAQSCVGGSRPTWLNEGLAVFAEGPLQPDFADALESAASDNSFEPLRSLNGAFPTHDLEAGIAYAQSYSVVAFMLEQYGPAKMQELLLTMAAGDGYDEALEAVYGFNVDGLEVAWRVAMGIPERSIPPTPTPIIAANVPTIVPAGAPHDWPTPPAAAEPPPAAVPESPGGCSLGLIPLLLVAWVGWRPDSKNERQDDSGEA